MKRILILLLLFFVNGTTYSQQSYWQGMGLTFNNHPRCMYYDSVTEQSYLAGGFQIVNGDSANIMLYNGQSFIAMPKAPIYYINSIIRYKDKIYAAGSGNGLACWDGASWTVIEPEGSYLNLKVYDNKLYAMGWYDEDRVTLPKGPVAVWDDTVWTGLAGIDSIFEEWGGAITDIAFYKGKVYVGGNWYNPAYPDKKDLMMHDGNSWQQVGFFGGDGMGGVNQLLVWRDTLYVAGMFLESPIIPGNSIAAWDGAQWHRLQQGVRSNSTGGGAIDAMTVYNDELWVGGMFYIINGCFVATNYGNVAKWNGSQWCTMGSRSTGSINDFGRWKDELFAVGNIFVDNDMSKYRFIKWTGGGYTDTCIQNFSTSIGSTDEERNSLQIFPNPAGNIISINYPKAFRSANCTIMDWSGRVVQTAVITPQLPDIDIKALAAGTYILSLDIDNKPVVCSKFVVK